jgi:hypothetical protein
VTSTDRDSVVAGWYSADGSLTRRATEDDSTVVRRDGEDLHLSSRNAGNFRPLRLGLFCLHIKDAAERHVVVLTVGRRMVRFVSTRMVFSLAHHGRTVGVEVPKGEAHTF